MIGVGVSLTLATRGQQGTGAGRLLGTFPNIMAFDFTDNSYAIRSTTAAELMIEEGADYALAFYDNSFAAQTKD
jgi:hypothetical protein